jgi:hypothetical protein
MQDHLYLRDTNAPRSKTMSAGDVKWLPAEPTEVFDTYWRFAAERQAIFYRKAMLAIRENQK